MYKIKRSWMILIILLFAIVDATALNYVKIYDTKPGLFLIGVLFFALYGGLKVGAQAGFAAGLIKDIFTGGAFGINILFLTLTGIFFGYNFSKFYRERAFVQFVLSFSLGGLYSFFYYILLKFMNNIRDLPSMDIGLWELLVTVGIPFSLYTAVIAPSLFLILRKIFHLRY